MPFEFERKFLVTREDLKAAHTKGLEVFEIRDTYIPSDDRDTPPLRIRISSPSVRFGDVETRTVVFNTKIGPPGHANELEWTWPPECHFVPPRGPRVEKLRHDWWEGLLHFHIEELTDPMSPSGELIAEVEFPDAQTKAGYVPPSHWVEVTGDKRYSNYSLALDGWPAATVLADAPTFAGCTAWASHSCGA